MNPELFLPHGKHPPACGEKQAKLLRYRPPTAPCSPFSCSYFLSLLVSSSSSSSSSSWPASSSS
jgi:hypothetical protein